MSRSSDITQWNRMYSWYRHTQLCMRLCVHVFSSLGSSETFNFSQCFSTSSPPVQHSLVDGFGYLMGGGPGVVVSTAAFHARARGSFLGLGVLKETKIFPPHPLVKLSIVGSLCDREVACSASDLQGLNFESCVRRAVLSVTVRHCFFPM